MEQLEHRQRRGALSSGTSGAGKSKASRQIAPSSPAAADRPSANGVKQPLADLGQLGPTARN